MKTKLHGGNLSCRATEKDLRILCAQKGCARDVQLTIEPTTGRSRAFAIVTMATFDGAQAALVGLHRHIWNGRHITVNEMRPAEAAPPQVYFRMQPTIRFNPIED